MFHTYSKYLHFQKEEPLHSLQLKYKAKTVMVCNMYITGIINKGKYFWAFVAV